jgi:hypothetical protein
VIYFAVMRSTVGRATGWTVRTAASAALAAALLLAPAAALAVGSVSTVSPRPMGMGGAFLAVEDEISAMAWNPAAFSPRECRGQGGFRVHLNALGALAVPRETGMLTGVESEPFAGLPVAEKVGIAVGSLVKSASYTRGGFSAGVLLLEEELDPVGLRRSKGLADASELLAGYYSCLTVVFRLGPTASIGMTQTIHAGLEDRERVFGVGRSYGALLRPNESVAVGFAYVDLPSRFAEDRREIEGLAARTMNAGLAYRPHESLVVTFDMRDLAEKHEGASPTSRAGLEWNLWGQGALRAGFHTEESSGRSVLSLGAGTIAMPGCRDVRDDSRGDAFVLSYATLLSDGRGPRHLLSVILHF